MSQMLLWFHFIIKLTLLGSCATCKIIALPLIIAPLALEVQAVTMLSSAHTAQVVVLLMPQWQAAGSGTGKKLQFKEPAPSSCSKSRTREDDMPLK